MGRKRNQDLDYVPVQIKISIDADKKLLKIQKEQRDDFNRKITKPNLITEIVEEHLKTK